MLRPSFIEHTFAAYLFSKGQQERRKKRLEGPTASKGRQTCEWINDTQQITPQNTSEEEGHTVWVLKGG